VIAFIPPPPVSAFSRLLTEGFSRHSPDSERLAARIGLLGCFDKGKSRIAL
jgi:hypothetical protein